MSADGSCAPCRSTWMFNVLVQWSNLKQCNLQCNVVLTIARPYAELHEANTRLEMHKELKSTLLLSANREY